MLNNLNHTMKIAQRCDVLIQRTADNTIHSKRVYLNILILHRAVIRGMLSTLNEAAAEYQYYTRHKKLMDNKGLYFPLVEVYIENKADVMKTVRKEIADIGRWTEIVLDCWQRAGATREELLWLCGFHGTLDAAPNTPFSKLLFVHNLDYPDNGDDWMKTTTDAPFTHAIKELWIHRITKTESGRQAAHGAMEAVFPELMEKVMTVQENEEGVKCLYDHTGELVGELE